MFHSLAGLQKSDDSEQSDDEVDAPHEYPSAYAGQNLTRLAFLCLIQRHFEASAGSSPSPGLVLPVADDGVRGLQ